MNSSPSRRRDHGEADRVLVVCMYRGIGVRENSDMDGVCMRVASVIAMGRHCHRLIYSSRFEFSRAVCCSMGCLTCPGHWSVRLSGASSRVPYKAGSRRGNAAKRVLRGGCGHAGALVVGRWIGIDTSMKTVGFSMTRRSRKEATCQRPRGATKHLARCCRKTWRRSDH